MKCITVMGAAFCVALCSLCTAPIQAACSYEQAILAEDHTVGVRLSWATNLEEAHAHFVVEASVDGQTFREVGRVAGAGDSDAIEEYEFLHVNAPSGTLYYRLQEVSTEGTLAEGPVAYHSREKAPAFYIAHTTEAFASEEMTITLEATTDGELEYELRHWSGELVDSYEVAMEKGFNELTLPLEHLDAAVYKINIRAGDTTEALTIRKIAEAPEREAMVSKD